MGDLIKGPWDKRPGQSQGVNRSKDRTQFEMRAAHEDEARLITGDRTAQDVIHEYRNHAECTPEAVKNSIDGMVAIGGLQGLLSALEHHVTHPGEFKPAWIFATALMYQGERSKPENHDIIPPPDAV